MNPRIPNKKEYLYFSQNSDIHPFPLKDCYPVAFSPQNQLNARVIQGPEKNSALLTQKILILKAPTYLTKIGLLSGTYSSSPHIPAQSFEGLVKSQIKNAMGHKCDLIMTWPQQGHHLKKLGFHYAGVEYRYQLQPFEFKKHLEFRILNSKQISPVALLKCFSRHTVSSHRNIRHFQLFLNIPNSDFYSVWDNNNKLRAYASVGKGNDLHQFIHEWGGDMNGVMSLLAHLAKDQKATHLLVPHHSFNLRRNLSSLNWHATTNFLGHIKILNSKSLMEKAVRHAKTLKVTNLHITSQNGGYYLGLGSEILKLHNDKELSYLLFGPLQKINWDGLSPQFKRTMESLFPLPFWVWGWDSL